MSASNKKANKAASPEEAMKQQRTQRLEEEEKKKQTLYTSICAVVAVVVLALVIWNQGFFDNTNAFSIDGTSYTTAQVQLYYTNTVYGALMGSYTPEAGGDSFDFTTPATEQQYSSNQTWHEFFSEESCRSLAQLQVTVAEGQAANFQMPQEGLEELEQIKSTLDTAWIGRTQNKESYLRLQYGMTENEFLAMSELEIYATYYQNYVYESFDYDQEDYEAFYQENQDSMDVITFSQVQYFATNGIVTDTEGNEIPLTEEEEATYTGYRTLVDLESTDVYDALEAGGELDEVLETIATNAQLSLISNTRHSSVFSGTDEASAWLLDSAREVGDITRTEDVMSNGTYFSVLVFEGRERASAPVTSIRHILIPANEEDMSADPTEEEWDASRQVAEELLATWEAEGSDPEAFSALAMEHSADSSSASSGGIMAGITPYDNYVEEFTAWFSDDSRQEGDTGIVQNTGSATQGWHIMYFDSFGLPLWENDSDINLKNQAIEVWNEDIADYVADNIKYDAGLKNITASSLF